MRVLLLNPPGRRLYIRDYYCSKVSQANYLPPPIDLLMLSAQLSGVHELRGLDAIARGLGAAAARRFVEEWDPDAIVFLAGAVSWPEDREFLRSVTHGSRGRRLAIGSGDLFREEAGAFFRENDWLDAVVLDFMADGAARFLDGERGALAGLVHRRALAPLQQETADLPVPRHDLFVPGRYRHPFARRRPLSTLLTDFGCPYPCSFCVMSTLGHKARSVESVEPELDTVWSLGVRELFVADQTFGLGRARALALCDALGRRGFSWFAFSRADVLDDDLARAMRAGGCHTVTLGVEVASDDRLRAWRKSYTVDRIREAFARCRRAGLRTAGTFLLGLPDETWESGIATIDLATRLGCDFASFNVAVPRAGTPLRRQAHAGGLLDDLPDSLDQSGTVVSMRTSALDREQVAALRRLALRRFYLRPGYLARRLFDLRSFPEARTQCSDMVHLLARAV